MALPRASTRPTAWMFSAYSFAQWGRPANCLFPMRRELSRHSEEAGWKPRDRHFPKYTRKDMNVTGADPTRTCFAVTLTDWRQYYSHSHSYIYATEVAALMGRKGGVGSLRGGRGLA